MKSNSFISIICVLAVIGGLILSSCEVTEAEEGTTNEGTIRLMNNSTNVIIVYYAIERFGTVMEEMHVNINPGALATTILNRGSYTIYLEDQHGDGWETRFNVNVIRDRTVDVRFPSDFKVAN